MSVDHDGRIIPVLDHAWGAGDTDVIAFVWDEMLLGNEAVVSTEWDIGEDFELVYDFGKQQVDLQLQVFMSAYALLLRCITDEDDLPVSACGAGKRAELTQSVVLSTGRRLSRTIFVQIVKN